VPAKGAVRCQRTEAGEGRRKDSEHASHNRQMGHGKGFREEDESGTRP